MRNAKCKIKICFFAFCIFNFAFLIASCSVPNLESSQCVEARDGVKQFYSFHFGNDMTPTAANLKAREGYLRPELFKKLSAEPQSVDYFTESADPPKTFKIGKCEATSDDKASLQVQIYWRDDAKTVQKEVWAEVVKTGGKWLINNVSARQ